MKPSLEHIIEQSLTEIYIIDADSLKFVYANAAAINNLGYSMEELFDLTPVETSTEYQRDTFKTILEPLRNTEKKSEVVVTNVNNRKDGSSYPVDVHLQFIQYADKPAYVAFIVDATEKRHVQEQLGLIIKGSSLGCWDWNVGEDDFQVDQCWLDMVGLNRDDVQDKVDSWNRFIHPDDLAHVKETIEKAIIENDPYVVEFRMIRKDGTVVWIQSAGSVVAWDETTKIPLRMCGTHRNITVRKLAELEKEQFHKFFQLSTDIMVIGDSKGILLKVNPSTLKILGYEEDELLGESFMNFMYNDDRLAAMDEMARQIETGSSLNFKNRFICKDGSLRWLSWTAKYDPDEGQSYATGRDITAQKNIEEKLHKQETMYRALAENSDDIIAHYDRQLRHIYVNPAVSKMLPFAPEDFIGKTHREMGFPEDLCKLWEGTMERVFSTGQSQSDFFDADSNEGRVNVNWNVFPGLRNGSEVETVFSVSRNITPYKKVEEELQKMQKLTSLGVLAGGIAHDFNNILTILFGNISLAKSYLEDDHISFVTLNKAEHAFHRATNLTSQLLTFAKGGDPVKEDVSISKLVKDTIEFDLSGSNVKLLYEFEDGLWLVKADKGQIGQVFSNLAINANQAMPEGGYLRVTLENSQINEGEVTGLKAGAYIKFTVTDDGVGIPAGELNHIFDPYFSTKQTGSGLGLATVYSIVKKHGGYVNVSSELGKGTCFLLYLPASNAVPVNSVKSITVNPKEQNEISKILIMDDEEMICTLAKKILEHDGYIVEIANEGLVAIEMYRKALERGESYDCIIMDLTIPGGMGGEEAVGKIIALDSEAKVIVSSGYAADPVMANYNDYGFIGVIPKPFTLISLREEVNRILQK